MLQLQYPLYLSAKAFATGIQPLTVQSGKTLLHLRVRKTQSCTEKYSCLKACLSCFRGNRQQSVTNLITLDGRSHWPREFLDLKAFNSNKAQAVAEIESSQDEIDQTGHPREASNAAVAQPQVVNVNPDNLLLAERQADPRLLDGRQRTAAVLAPLSQQ